MTHLSDLELEDYLLNRLSEGDCACAEEHLLVCVVCQDAIRQKEIYVKSMQAASLRESSALSKEKGVIPIDSRKKN